MAAIGQPHSIHTMGGAESKGRGGGGGGKEMEKGGGVEGGRMCECRPM